MKKRFLVNLCVVDSLRPNCIIDRSNTDKKKEVKEREQVSCKSQGVSQGCYVIRCFFRGKSDLKTVLES